MTFFFISESRLENEGCFFINIKTRNICLKILRNQKRRPRLLEGHSGDTLEKSTFNAHRDLKFGAASPMYMLNIPDVPIPILTPAMNQRHPLIRLLGGRFGEPGRSTTCNAHRDWKFGKRVLQCIRVLFLMPQNPFDINQEPAETSSQTPWRTIWRHLGEALLVMHIETGNSVYGFIKVHVEYS